MPKFRYTAVDPAGKLVHGALDATNEMVVADQLQGRGNLLLSVNEVGRHGWVYEILHADLALNRGFPKATVANFTRELSVLLSAGQDLDHALRFLVESSENKRLKQLLDTLRQQVRGGKSLAAGLSEHPAIFSRLYISLVRAGEAGGNLAESLAHLAGLLEREARLTASIKSALTYPILLIVASLATIVLLLTSVLPQFTPIFEQAGAKLPRGTRILIATGDFVREDGAWMLALILMAVLVLNRLAQRPGPRMTLERALLALPIAGALTRRVQAARFTRTVGTLLRNGVNLVGALAIGRGVLGNLIANRTVERAEAQVKSGRRLGAALAADPFFPAQTVHLIELGEETGKLSEMMLRAADIHDDQVHQSVQRLVALMVPIITIVMGLVVGGIVGSLLVAMLSLNDLAI